MKIFLKVLWIWLVSNRMVLRMRRCTPHGTAFRVGLLKLRAAGTSKKYKSLRRSAYGGGLGVFQKKGGGDQPMAWRMRAAMSSTVPRPSMTFCLPWAA